MNMIYEPKGYKKSRSIGSGRSILKLEII